MFSNAVSDLDVLLFHAAPSSDLFQIELLQKDYLGMVPVFSEIVLGQLLCKSIFSSSIAL